MPRIYHRSRTRGEANLPLVSYRPAMVTITGHRTRSVFKRYNIVSPSDLQVAAQKIATHPTK